MAAKDKRKGWLAALAVGDPVCVGAATATIAGVSTTGRINVTMPTGAIIKFGPNGISYDLNEQDRKDMLARAVPGTAALAQAPAPDLTATPTAEVSPQLLPKPPEGPSVSRSEKIRKSVPMEEEPGTAPGTAPATGSIQISTPAIKGLRGPKREIPTPPGLDPRAFRSDNDIQPGGIYLYLAPGSPYTDLPVMLVGQTRPYWANCNLWVCKHPTEPTSETWPESLTFRGLLGPLEEPSEHPK